MKKLWQKNKIKLNTLIEEFETMADLSLDQQLVEPEIYGSIAHAKMLNSIGILSSEELQKLQQGLLEIFKLNKKKAFNLQHGDEDIHTKVENFLVKNYGDVGKKIHTGRSRNDQVLLDLRLFTKEKLLILQEKLIGLACLFADQANMYANIPMPGYTHMQKAMPSSVGMWLGAYAESLTDDLKLIQAAYSLNDQSPLGSAAAYGVTLPLDRKLVADLLGFKKVQNNSLYCQNSRGKFESLVIFSLLQAVLDISKFASDLLLFTTSEFNYFEVAKELTTGSSIMPQKINLDIAELLRSKVHILNGYLFQIFNTSANLPSGYNRDIQDTKKPYCESLKLVEKIFGVTEALVQGIKPKKENLEKQMTPELFATKSAYELTAKGLPFREAYQQVAKNLNQLPSVNAQEVLKMSKHLGGTGNLRMKNLKRELLEHQLSLSKQKSEFHSKLKKLLINNI